MSYFRYIDNGEGPTKLFVGGVHGNEGLTSIRFMKRIKEEDLGYYLPLRQFPYQANEVKRSLD